MKIIKWILFGLLALLAVAASGVFYFKSKFENRERRIFQQKVTSFPIPTDSASLARGKIISVECRTCHEVDYSGKVFLDDPTLGIISPPNITGARGSATENYTDIDWIRTLRHGLAPNGRNLFVMPAENIGQYSDEDLGCLIAFMKTIPRVEKPRGETKLTLLGKVLGGSGALGPTIFPHDIIQHDKVASVKAPGKSNSAEYGNYFTRFGGCRACHGDQFNGGVSPDPTAPPAPNITKSGNLGKWSLDQFKSTLRTGTTPEGKILQAQFMPWPGYGVFEDIELEALYNYLNSLPALPDSKAYASKAKKIKQ